MEEDSQEEKEKYMRWKMNRCRKLSGAGEENVKLSGTGIEKYR